MISLLDDFSISFYGEKDGQEIVYFSGNLNDAESFLAGDGVDDIVEDEIEEGVDSITKVEAKALEEHIEHLSQKYSAENLGSMLASEMEAIMDDVRKQGHSGSYDVGRGIHLQWRKLTTDWLAHKAKHSKPSSHWFYSGELMDKFTGSWDVMKTGEKVFEVIPKDGNVGVFHVSKEKGDNNSYIFDINLSADPVFNEPLEGTLDADKMYTYRNFNSGFYPGGIFNVSDMILSDIFDKIWEEIEQTDGI